MTVSRLFPIEPDQQVSDRVTSFGVNVRDQVALGHLLIYVKSAATAFEQGDDEQVRYYLSRSLGALVAVNPFAVSDSLGGTTS